MRRLTVVLALAFGLAVSIAACGGAGMGTEDVAAPPSTPDVSSFPSAQGKTLADLRSEMGPGGPVLASSVSVLEPGQKNRVGFGLFDRSRKQITGADVGIYVAPAGGGPAAGPFPARSESLDVKPQYESQTTSSDPDAAHSVYVAEVPIKKPGQYEFLGAVNLDGRVVAADPANPPIAADPKSRVPDVGDRAPSIDTPTVADAQGDLSKIDTRQPPAPELLQKSFADVVGKQPAILLFATPALCSSRVCGPVTDIELQVSADHPDDVAFIHQEIYRDNDPNKGVQPQVAKYGLESEPWLFAVDANGRIVERLEGAFSVRELQEAVAKAEAG
jgi:hypothetical protein